MAQVINEDGGIDYSVDTTFWIKGLNQDFMKYDLEFDQLKPFGFKAMHEINQLIPEVSENLIMGIKLYWLLAPIYEMNENLDASCCAILFCKAIELQIKKNFAEPFKRILPDFQMKNFGKGGKTLKDANSTDLTLGTFVSIINKNKTILANQMKVSGKSGHDEQWWSSFADKLCECTKRRNKCCHAGVFNWNEQERLRFDVFLDDNSAGNIERNPRIGGLMFESFVGKQI